MEPSLNDEELKEFTDLYGLSALKFLKNREGKTIPVAFAKAPLQVAQVLDRTRHGGFAGCGITFQLASGYPDDLMVFPHCSGCHRWGHWAQGCSFPARCGRCGSREHSDCSPSECICPNCGGPHPGWSRKCNAFRTYRKCWTDTPKGAIEGDSSITPSCQGIPHQGKDTAQSPSSHIAAIEDLNRAWEGGFNKFSKNIEVLICSLVDKAFGGLLGACVPTSNARTPPCSAKRPPSSDQLKITLTKNSEAEWTRVSANKKGRTAARSNSSAATSPTPRGTG